MSYEPVPGAKPAMEEVTMNLGDRQADPSVFLTGQVVELDDTLWEDLVTLTGGSATLCFQCGACTATCPWGLVKEDTFSVRRLIRGAQLGLDTAQEYLWLCAACGQCETLCPRGVSIGDVIRGVRQLAWQDRRTPTGLPTVLWSLHGNNNPWGQPPSARSTWANDLQVPFFDPKQHEILLYVGCTAAYDRRIQGVARALVKLLQISGVDFGTLADVEPCCGEPALSLGHRPFFDELIGGASAIFRQYGALRVVTVSPHCYHIFQEQVSATSGEIEFLHYSQYLAFLVGQGRLVVNDLPPARVAFHDPCYLARHHADEASPRQVLAAIPGVEVIEMAHYGRDTICCGGGGGRMWLETAPNERFADLRVAEAVEVAADYLVTACPFCLSCLEDSVKAQKRRDVRVLDLAELTAQAVISVTQGNQDRTGGPESR